MSETAVKGTQTRRPRAAKPPAPLAPAPLGIAWHREADPPAHRRLERWCAEVTAQDFRARLTLDPGFSGSWVWQVQFVTPNADGMILTGYSPTFEAAQEDAQAGVRLRAESRPVYLDRRPLYSVAAPTQPSPAPAGFLTVENRPGTSFVLPDAAALQALLERLDRVKRAASALAGRSSPEAEEALRVAKYITGESIWLAILHDYESDASAGAGSQ